MSRERLTRAFLWLSIAGWGIGLGAKLFDLLVVAGAWSASPPASFSLLPYGPRFPVDPGDFFQPLSAIMVDGVVGALVAGWKTRPGYRLWLWIPALAFLVVWVFTPTVFWPMIRELHGTATGKLARTDAQSLELARRWILWDWMRVTVIAVGFLSCVRAISIPYPRER
jgi:hypothetical protein